MKYLLKLGPLLSYILAFLIIPIPDYLSKLVYAFGSVFAYGVLMVITVYAFPKVRQGLNGLWCALSISAIAATITFFVLHML